MKPRRTLRMTGSVTTRHMTMLNVADIDARRRLLLELRKKLNASARHAERTTDPATVHDLRASTRRLRILLRALRHDVDPALYASVRFDLHNLAGVAGPAREAYVRKQIVLPWLESGAGHSAQAAKLCLPILDVELERATMGLHAVLQGREWSSSLARINRALASPRLFGLATGQPRASLSISFAKLLRKVDRHKINPADRIHRLRIKTRNAYYLGEMLQSLSGKPVPPVIRRLKKMQSALGDLHDAMQFRDWLLAARLPDPVRKTLLRKVGKLENRQLDRCRKQRKAFRPVSKHFLLARRAT